jgi:hypothetical protein
MKDHIRYDVLARDAMRSVLRRVLEDAAKQGLPGDHHFYITFLTHAEGVKVSPRLLAQYPNEMTIILQHQFWDLVVTEDHFEVGLSFGSIPEKLVVPFAAIKAFLDPSVQFGLTFETGEVAVAEAPAAPAPAPATAPKDKAKNESRSESKADNKTESMPQDQAPAEAEDNKPHDGEHKPSEGAEVVRLDRFRKK